MMPRVKLGFVPASRRYFSTEMAAKAREQTLAALTSLGIEVVVPDTAMTEAGCVKNRDEGRRCAELFRREDVDGIIVGAVNFGDEQGCAPRPATARRLLRVAFDRRGFASIGHALHGCTEADLLSRGGIVSH